MSFVKHLPKTLSASDEWMINEEEANITPNRITSTQIQHITAKLRPLIICNAEEILYTAW